jgi:hypothetical protein
MPPTCPIVGRVELNRRAARLTRLRTRNLFAELRVRHSKPRMHIPKLTMRVRFPSPAPTATPQVSALRPAPLPRTPTQNPITRRGQRSQPARGTGASVTRILADRRACTAVS